MLFVQFSNPAAYPPVLHATRLLAEAGWAVDVLGVAMDGSESFRSPDRPGIRTTLWPLVPAGRARQVQYARFVASAVGRVARERPTWVYASDPFAAPVVAVIKRLKLARVVYHEHDAPGVLASAMMLGVSRARLAAARTADLLVVPNDVRLARLVKESKREGPAACVWNVPAVSEVRPARARLTGIPTLYYHGTLNPERLPVTVLEAMALVEVPLSLHVVGYETVGSQGYAEAFIRWAGDLGLASRTHMHGALDARADILAAAHLADIGLALMPAGSDDLNMAAMAGASNKPFDYLTGGLALVVSDLPAWRDLYVTPGYGLAADPRDAGSLAAAFARLASNPAATRRMGENGRERILRDWNYEATFSAVMDAMSTPEQA